MSNATLDMACLLADRKAASDLTGNSTLTAQRRAMEAQLAQAQKLESIGELAAGIAHEINTPSQYIGDNTRFLRDAFADLRPLLARCLELRDGAAPRRQRRSLAIDCLFPWAGGPGVPLEGDSRRHRPIPGRHRAGNADRAGHEAILSSRQRSNAEH